MTYSKLMMGTAIAVLAAQAQVAQARVTYICPELHGSELKVRVDSGCMSTSTSYTDNDLTLEVDQNTATIRVTGDIEYNSGGPIHTADCMGATSFTLSAENIDVRNFAVFYKNTKIGEANFIENRKPKQCLGTRAARSHQGSMKFIQYNTFQHWDNNPLDGWREWRGDSVFDLLSPVLDGHPETMEGVPTMSMKMEKAKWHRHFSIRERINWRDPFIMITFEQKGYLDDSVSAGRYAAAIRMDENGKWKLDGFWAQHMCARGKNAGQWTGSNCP
ncbi:hypothetical protein [Erythrobacter sp. THAF29]|uniref:hypothetical protein n=1 Tax=Erythrobacter sp. THAF29 TaxID=2587851 RepID=UPI0012678AB6|nr:hypothetical protein [Erythrobacter sp. THAF29]QFT78666.1 hypothetical protein FIU90_14040 [Erythrobacter sp. THAF29]